MTGALRSNLSVVLDTTPDDRTVGAMLPEVLYQSASGTFDFFRSLGATPEENRRLVEIPDGLWHVLDEGSRTGRGVLIVAPHVGVQDLMGIGFSASPRHDAYDVQVLSYALPPSGYKLVNSLRATEGLRLTPSSGESMRKAGELLRSGGVVFTSLDRPPPRSKTAQTAEFFGRPARLWDGFARLAVSTDALLQIIWVERLPDSRYRLNLVRQLDPRDMAGGDPAADLWRAALAEAETIIRKHPEQWLMFFPVWPETP